jgi:hypothetical protein
MQRDYFGVWLHPTMPKKGIIAGGSWWVTIDGRGDAYYRVDFYRDKITRKLYYKVYRDKVLIESYPKEVHLFIKAVIAAMKPLQQFYEKLTESRNFCVPLVEVLNKPRRKKIQK